MIDLKTARQRADELRTRADALLEEYQIVDTLGAIGPVECTGSYAYDLMVVPDIDMEIYNPSITPSEIYDLGKQLFLRTHRIGMSDRTQLPLKESRPVGVYIGSQIDFQDQRWKIDIWVMPDHSSRQHTMTEFQRPDWFKRTTQEQREAMLLLKHQLHEEGTYNAPVASYQVYKAVLEDVTELSAFKDWLEREYGLRV